jgi:alpha-ketoglutarate-dependent taurine dioxygenase
MGTVCLTEFAKSDRLHNCYQLLQNRMNDVLAHQNITPGLGAELAPEIQLTSLSDGQINALQQLASERGIVVARGQVMSLQEQAEFAHRLGEPLTRPTEP